MSWNRTIYLKRTRKVNETASLCKFPLARLWVKWKCFWDVDLFMLAYIMQHLACMPHTHTHSVPYESNFFPLSIVIFDFYSWVICKYIKDLTERKNISNKACRERRTDLNKMPSQYWNVYMWRKFTLCREGRERRIKQKISNESRSNGNRDIEHTALMTVTTTTVNRQMDDGQRWVQKSKKNDGDDKKPRTHTWSSSLQFTQWGSENTTEEMTNKYTLNKYLVDGEIEWD